MNRVSLVGRLVRDPEVKYTQGGTCVASFSLAVNRWVKDKEEADFIPVTVWGKMAETCGNHLVKGSQAAVSGSLKTHTYEDKDKKKRFAMEVWADRVEFIGKKPEGAGKTAISSAPATETQSAFGQEVPMDQDIPF